MQLETFLHNLHFSIDEIMPQDKEINWADAPFPINYTVIYLSFLFL